MAECSKVEWSLFKKADPKRRKCFQTFIFDRNYTKIGLNILSDIYEIFEIKGLWAIIQELRNGLCLNNQILTQDSPWRVDLNVLGH